MSFHTTIAETPAITLVARDLSKSWGRIYLMTRGADILLMSDNEQAFAATLQGYSVSRVYANGDCVYKPGEIYRPEAIGGHYYAV